jgi:hypothetical protein
MKKLFTCLYGSNLYGTSTPESDRDVKHIVLPSLDDLLLGKTVKNAVNKTNKDRSVKNTSDDVDEEFIPIQVFAKDFLAGQTYALELAFAVDGDHAEQTFYHDGWRAAELYPVDFRFKRFCTELRTKFLTSNMHAMTRYAVNQANLYSDKGERLNAAKELLAVFNSMPSGDYTLRAWSHLFEGQVAFLAEQHPTCIQITEYDQNGKGSMKPCIKLLERVIPYNCTFATSAQTVQRIIDKYGARAAAASVDNVDWKAMSHAVRIVNEGVALLLDQSLYFPFPERWVDYLKAVKTGVIPFDDVQKSLEGGLEHLKMLEDNSELPRLTTELRQQHEAWLIKWLKEFYL